MARRQYAVSDEIAYRWSERHRRGDSFRKIALDEGVERRLVARIVKGLDKTKHLNEIAAALRDVRAGFLREHLGLFERVANSLLELTAPPSVCGSECVSYLKVEAELVKRVKAERYRNIAGVLLVRADLSGKVEEEIKDPERLFKLQLADRRADREAGVLVADLREHLPDLWPEVEKWERVAANYEASWRELVKQAKEKGIAQDLFEPGLRAGLDLSKFEHEENLPRVPPKLETGSDVGVWLFRNGRTRDPLILFRRYREQLEAAYVQLEDVLNPFELRKALLARQCKHCPLA